MIYPRPPPPSRGLLDPVKVILYLSLSIYVSRWCSFEEDNYDDGSFWPAYSSILSSPKHSFSAKLELGQWIYYGYHLSPTSKYLCTYVV